MISSWLEDPARRIHQLQDWMGRGYPQSSAQDQHATYRFTKSLSLVCAPRRTPTRIAKQVWTPVLILTAVPLFSPLSFSLLSFVHSHCRRSHCYCSHCYLSHSLCYHSHCYRSHCQRSHRYRSPILTAIVTQLRNLPTELVSLHISPHGVRLERCKLSSHVRTC